MTKTAWLWSVSLALGGAGSALADGAADGTVEGDSLFDAPVRLRAVSGDVTVNHQVEGLQGSGHGHAGPHRTDFDQDGVADLLVGDIFGFVFFFKGLEGDGDSAYADPVPVRMADGEALKFKNW